MADPGRRARVTTGIAQVLLLIGAAALWAASRLTWVVIRSFDGLGQPKDVMLSGATWSSALLPLAIVNVAAAIAALAVRGWRLRALAVLLAASSFAIGYLGVSLWAIPDVAARGADLAHVPVVTLVGSGRQYTGAVITVVAAAGTLIAAALFMRAASVAGQPRARDTKYLAPSARRAIARHEDADADETQLSERMIWDALDEGRDPTDRESRGGDGPRPEGRYPS